ncbi:MAG: ribose-phosphate pyrophosphokinase-like domain-containing protein, partial [Usitatibacteraceae bacterium]
DNRCDAVQPSDCAIPAAPISLHRFPDGETSLRTTENVSGKHVAIACTLDHPDEKLAPLLFATDLLRDMGAASVGLVAPYLAYMRQDIRFNPGESVTARYFARLISASFDWLVTVDPAIGEWVRKHVKDAGLVGPDAESSQWVSEVAKRAGVPYRVLEKTRNGDHSVVVSPLDTPWVKERSPIIVDDIASTAGTLIAAAGAITAAGGTQPVCIIVHALFAGDAYALLKNAGVSRVVSCDTVLHESNAISLQADLAEAVDGLMSRQIRPT